MPEFPPLPDYLFPYSCLVHRPDPDVEYYEAYKNIGRKYTILKRYDLASTVINSGMSALTTGSLFVKNGIYVVNTTLLHKQGVYLIGESRDGTILKAKDGLDEYIIATPEGNPFAISQYDYVLANFTVDLNGAKQTTGNPAIYDGIESFLIDNVKFIHPYGTSLLCSGSAILDSTVYNDVNRGVFFNRLFIDSHDQLYDCDAVDLGNGRLLVTLNSMFIGKPAFSGHPVLSSAFGKTIVSKSYFRGGYCVGEGAESFDVSDCEFDGSIAGNSGVRVKDALLGGVYAGVHTNIHDSLFYSEIDGGSRILIEPYQTGIQSVNIHDNRFRGSTCIRTCHLGTQVIDELLIHDNIWKDLNPNNSTNLEYQGAILLRGATPLRVLNTKIHDNVYHCLHPSWCICLENDSAWSGGGFGYIEDVMEVHHEKIVNLSGLRRGTFNPSDLISRIIGVRYENVGYAVGTGSQEAIAHGCDFTPSYNQVFLSERTTGSALAKQTAIPDETYIYVTATSEKDFNWCVSYLP